MKSLLNIRNFIQRNEAKHWQFIVLVLFLSVAGAVLALFLQVKVLTFLYPVIIIITSILQSLISYFFMKEKGEANKVFITLLFVFILFFLNRYLYFEHFYDFYLEAYIDKSILSWSLLIFYFKSLNFEGVFLFVDQMPNFMELMDYVLLVAILIITMIYQILPFENTFSKNTNKKTKRIRFKERKFS